MQRYENKSKSQLVIKVIIVIIGCLRLCKDTKIKANHNSWYSFFIVLMLSKTLQRYENKSKSQHPQPRACDDARCLRLCKDTKIKANHNYRSI